MLIIDKEVSYRFTRAYTIDVIIDYNKYNPLELQFFKRLCEFGGNKVKITEVVYEEEAVGALMPSDSEFSEEFNKKLDDIYKLNDPQ